MIKIRILYLLIILCTICSGSGNAQSFHTGDSIFYNKIITAAGMNTGCHSVTSLNDTSYFVGTQEHIERNRVTKTYCDTIKDVRIIAIKSPGTIFYCDNPRDSMQVSNPTPKPGKTRKQTIRRMHKNFNAYMNPGFHFEPVKCLGEIHFHYQDSQVYYQNEKNDFPQYSLKRSDTITQYDLSYPPMNPIDSFDATRITYSGDTSIFIGKQQFDCLKFLSIGFYYYNEYDVKSVATILIEKNTYIPILELHEDYWVMDFNGGKKYTKNLKLKETTLIFISKISH
jgi:hypothetical protein